MCICQVLNITFCYIKFTQTFTHARKEEINVCKLKGRLPEFDFERNKIFSNRCLIYLS